MAYNENLPADTTAPAEIRENFRALKNDKIVAAASAITATKLETARLISISGDASGSAAFDGTENLVINLDVVSADVAAECTGNAATATKLKTARKINDVLFDGTEDITISTINGKDIVTVDQLPTSLPANGGNSDTVDGLHANEIVAQAMPIGGIIMWSGGVATVPEKWHLCDGSNGTPDLRNRFVVGAGNTYSVGGTGGEANHTLTINEIPSHSHGSTASGGVVNASATGLRFNSGGMIMWSYEETQPWPTVQAAAYSGSAATSNVGGGQAHNNLPPYYALAYIMKVA